MTRNKLDEVEQENVQLDTDYSLAKLSPTLGPQTQL